MSVSGELCPVVHFQCSLVIASTNISWPTATTACLAAGLPFGSLYLSKGIEFCN